MKSESVGSIDFLNAIIKDAESQASAILTDAKEAAKKKIDRAEVAIAEIENSYNEKLKDEEKRLLKNQQNNIEMEKRKFELTIREQIITSSISNAIAKIKEASTSKEYPNVIKELIIEAIMGIGKTDLLVSISTYEEAIVTEKYLDALSSSLSKEIGLPLKLALSPIRLRKQGVVVADNEGRVVYDNQFETRLVRYQSQVRKAVYEVIAQEMENGN